MMTEKEVLEKLSDAANNEPIPDSIKPEHIKEKLRRESDGHSLTESSQRKSRESNSSRRYWHAGRVTAAALVLVLCGAAGMQVWKLNQNQDVSESAGVGEVTSADASADIAEGMEEVETELAKQHTEAAKQDAGDLYTVAKDYDEVYDLLKKQTSLMRHGDIVYDMGDTTTSGIAVDISAAAESGSLVESVSDSLKYAAEEAASDTETSYSKTNLQTEGVDESDIIKTDGSYIYTVTGNRIVITDIRDGALEEVAEIPVSLQSTSDSILEMYVEQGILSLIIQRESTGLEKENVEKSGEDVYYLSSDMVTEIRTYDISNPKVPQQSGSMTQDGYYHTSRKIGDILYLFTDENMGAPILEKEQAIEEDNVGGWIPVVNQKPIAADSIYLSDEARQGLVISAVDVKNPNVVVDNTMILSGYVDIYVSMQAVYLYQENYNNGKSTTQIAKFSLNEGTINAVNAVSVNGEVRDTFAINENQGRLRVLTTDSNFTGGESTNQLYLFDENLELTGKIENIAAGEEIYAARYLGDMAYFVTYRNTDPLFAVDLSDQKNPKIVGELEITGFSEYLHFWGEDKLVGIGYETDAESGSREGVKITMFDISNPAELREIKTLVLKNVNYSQALYNYKCVLADADENLLGFTTEDYSSSRLDYLLFAWEDGAFVNLMSEKLASNFSSDNFRGIYVDDIFYVADQNGIRSFDRNAGYALLKQLEF